MISKKQFSQDIAKINIKVEAIQDYTFIQIMRISVAMSDKKKKMIVHILWFYGISQIPLDKNGLIESTSMDYFCGIPIKQR